MLCNIKTKEFEFRFSIIWSNVKGEGGALFLGKIKKKGFHPYFCM